MRVLITSSCYINSSARADELLLWARLTRMLNLDTEILLVDSCSPFDARALLNKNFSTNINVIARMEDNVGHPTTGGDGWGRDLCWGIEYAASRAYDWIVFIESDLMFYKPITPIIEKLCRIGCLAAAPISFKYHWIETGLMFLSVPMLLATRFVEQYSWHTHTPPFGCEAHVQRILDPEFLALPLRGLRNEEGELTLANHKALFPFGVDYLTHCADFSLYPSFAKLNGIDI
jgi:hypothetical protein